MSDDIILKLFYEEIVPMASKTGIIEVDGIRYNIHFNSIIGTKEYIDDDSVPCLIIRNIDDFNNALIEYTRKEYEIINNPIFYDLLDAMCGYRVKDKIKYILSTVFINAREEDFKNPVEFLKLRIKFIENNQLFLKYNNYQILVAMDDKEIEIFSNLQSPSLETPYAFRSRIKYLDGDNIKYYNLPNISYGIADGKAYIYAIQKNKGKNEEDKKINRFLYKINKGVEDDQEYYDYKELERQGIDSIYPENITDITHNSVLALTVFFGILKRENITDIVVVDYLPLRYLSKRESITTKMSLYKKIYSDKEMEEKLISHKNKQDRDQNNMTNKFIRTFNRVNYHLNNLDIISFPGEIDNSMHLRLNDNIVENDNIINEVYRKVISDELKRK